MPFIETNFPGLLIFEPRVFHDERGYFFESYNQQVFEQAGLNYHFVQDNQARSSKGVFRGLHYQKGSASQAKLVRVVEGSVLDVVLDLRHQSPTFGQAFGLELSAENKRQLLVPRGFAHGYLVLSEVAEFVYKCDNFYDKNAEGGIHYLDPSLQKLDWPLDPQTFLVSDKDKQLPFFNREEHIF
jgi:dTDP-4-dehydrorhamnose 3,5-epimerase